MLLKLFGCLRKVSVAVAFASVLMLTAGCGTAAAPRGGATTPQTAAQNTSGSRTHPGQTGKTVAYAGIIASVTGQQVSLVTNTHHTISLVLTSSTKVLSEAAGQAATVAQATSLATGQRIRARALAGTAGLTAVQITVFGAPHAGATLRGTVAAAGPTSLTIRTASGKQVSLALPPEVAVQIVPKSGPATASTVGSVKAGAIVTVHVTRSTSGSVANLIRIHTE